MVKASGYNDIPKHFTQKSQDNLTREGGRKLGLDDLTAVIKFREVHICTAAVGRWF